MSDSQIRDAARLSTNGTDNKDFNSFIMHPLPKAETAPLSNRTTELRPESKSPIDKNKKQKKKKKSTFRKARLDIPQITTETVVDGLDSEDGTKASNGTRNTDKIQRTDIPLKDSSAVNLPFINSTEDHDTISFRSPNSTPKFASVNSLINDRRSVVNKRIAKLSATVSSSTGTVTDEDVCGTKDSFLSTPVELTKWNSSGRRATLQYKIKSWLGPQNTSVNKKIFGGSSEIQREQRRTRVAGWVIHPCSAFR